MGWLDLFAVTLVRSSEYAVEMVTSASRNSSQVFIKSVSGTSDVCRFEVVVKFVKCFVMKCWMLEQNADGTKQLITGALALT